MCVCMFFTSTDRASTIPTYICGCQSGTWSAGQEKFRGTSTSSNESMKTKTKTKQKERNSNTNTRQKKIEKGHSIERVWYTASREPSDTSSGLQLSRICTQMHSIYNSVLSGFQVSLSAQSTLFGEPLGRSNQHGSKTSQACYSHSRCNLNLVHFFRFSLPLPVFGHLFTHAAINLQPPSRIVLHQTPESSAAVLQYPVMTNSRRSSATQPVHSFTFLPGPRFPVFSSSPDMILLGNLWSPMQSSALDHNNLFVRTVFSMLSHSVRWRASL